MGLPAAPASSAVAAAIAFILLAGDLCMSNAWLGLAQAAALGDSQIGLNTRSRLLLMSTGGGLATTTPAAADEEEEDAPAAAGGRYMLRVRRRVGGAMRTPPAAAAAADGDVMPPSLALAPSSDPRRLLRPAAGDVTTLLDDAAADDDDEDDVTGGATPSAWHSSRSAPASTEDEEEEDGAGCCAIATAEADAVALAAAAAAACSFMAWACMGPPCTFLHCARGMLLREHSGERDSISSSAASTTRDPTVRSTSAASAKLRAAIKSGCTTLRMARPTSSSTRGASQESRSSIITSQMRCNNQTTTPKRDMFTIWIASEGE